MLEPIYFAIAKAMQQVFIRNFQTGEMVGRVYLDSFPTSLIYNPKN